MKGLLDLDYDWSKLIHHPVSLEGSKDRGRGKEGRKEGGREGGMFKGALLQQVYAWL